MPLDRHFDRDFYQRSYWKLRFCWWPRRCDRSLKWIWLKLAYQGTWLITGPGDAIVMQRWLSKEEFMIFGLSK